MNKIPSHKVGGLRRTQLDCETVAIMQHNVLYELQKSSPGPIKPEFEYFKDDVICPPSESSNSSDRPRSWPRPFECWTYATEVLTQKERAFLTMFIEQLVAHICNRSHTSTGNVDMGKIEALVRARTANELLFSAPQTFDKMHIPIYKHLCQQFGSKYLLREAVVLGDGAFEAAVAERLKAQLRASAQKPDSLLKRHFFKRSTKVSPLCDIKSCHSDENGQENRATPPPLTRRTAVRSRLSSMASTVKKTFNGNLIASES